MKKTVATIAALSICLAVAACNNEGHPNEAAKSIQGSPAVILDVQTYTQSDLDLLNNIKSNNDRRVRSILDAGSATLYSSDENDVSGLMAAAALPDSTIIKLLLAKAPDGDDKIVNRGDKTGKTPMLYAVESGAPENIIELRKKGANPNVWDSLQVFPLIAAAKAGKLDHVKAILQDIKGMTPANPDLQDASGSTAAIEAARIGDKKILTVLKAYGANLNASASDGTTPLNIMVTTKNKELFEYLLTLGADINALNSVAKTPLVHAIDIKDYDFAKFILDKGANPNAHGQGLASPLQVLVSQDNSDQTLVDYLLAKGAALTDPNIPTGNVLSRAIHKGNAPVIAKLIAKGAKVSDLESSTTNGLFEALQIEDPDIAMIMIQNGADILKFDDSGFSPLAIAAKKHYVKAFEAMVKKGADVNQTSRNKTAVPVEIVIDNDDGELLEIMLNNGLKASLDAILLRAVSAKEDNILHDGRCF